MDPQRWFSAIIDGDSVLKCEALATFNRYGFVLEDGGSWRCWLDSTLINRVTDMHTPDCPTFEVRFLLPLCSAIRNVDLMPGMLTAQLDVLNRKFAKANMEFEEKKALVKQKEAFMYLNINAATLDAREELLRQRMEQLNSQSDIFANFLKEVNQGFNQRYQYLDAREEELSRLTAAVKKLS
ncbi:uncharacterized protein TM35_000211790 [Trypanosoma theileri]|uniref:Uncharacterized protein n=1 Tax=Trypanosoma theileri TaxID=67003 RepID=A0A1X0NSY7_9TRYP|nr:uncharacterized protein TM35_000211790 [Trypanosoma theileri]ORC87573.1 hypothetical protein TM35_000211790 [Trypanosoma theileri]